MALAKVGLFEALNGMPGVFSWSHPRAHSLSFYFDFFKTESPYVAQADLELAVWARLDS